MTYLSDVIDYADHVGAKAIARYGAKAQTMMGIEECGELLSAVAQLQRGRRTRAEVVEECADVIITVLQLARIHSADTRDLERAISAKTDRLAARLTEENET